jgi:hypothetical protein
MNLHEDKEVFATIITTASQYMRLPEIYVEKDYWITRSLKYLSASAVSESVVFKGGTALSKAHKLIQRFSEDVDLAVIANGLGDQQRKSLLKKVETAASQGLIPLVDDERNSKGSKFRKTVYRYPRNNIEAQFGQASSELLLEVNTFTRPEPCERKVIQTMIAEMLIVEGRQDLLNQYELGFFELNVLSVHRTLIEKLLGIIKDSYSTDPISRLKNRIRHIYDVCMILKLPDHREFVASLEFKKLCQFCIVDERTAWGEEKTVYLNKPLYTAPLFSRLKEWWPQIENTYNGVFANLVYGDLPSVDNINETLELLHQELIKM